MFRKKTWISVTNISTHHLKLRKYFGFLFDYWGDIKYYTTNLILIEICSNFVVSPSTREYVCFFCKNLERKFKKTDRKKMKKLLAKITWNYFRCFIFLGCCFSSARRLFCLFNELFKIVECELNDKIDLSFDLLVFVIW
jgi:hypothetical protein